MTCNGDFKISRYNNVYGCECNKMGQNVAMEALTEITTQITELRKISYISEVSDYWHPIKTKIMIVHIWDINFKNANIHDCDRHEENVPKRFGSDKEFPKFSFQMNT